MLRLSRASLLSATALISHPVFPLLAAAPPPLFHLTLPPDFVKIGATNGQGNVLLMAGDFRGMIASTGAATTISVQRLQTLELPEVSEDAAAAAAAASMLARLRDTQSAAVGQSELILASVTFDGTTLGFEFLTPLVGDIGTSAADVPDELKRHTLAVASKDSRGGAVVLWAGAREADWQAGAGVTLRAAAATFGVTATDGTAMPMPLRTIESRTNAHYGPEWAAASK